MEGCTAAYVSRIEAGERVPSYQLLLKFAERLSVSPDYLATGEEKTAVDDLLLGVELMWRSGDIDGAREAFGELVDASDPIVAARAAAGLGRLEADRGEHETAASHFEAALESGRLSPDEEQRAHEQLGRARALLGRFDEALFELNEATKQAETLGDQPALLRAAVLLANTHIDRGSSQQAEEVLASVIERARQTNDPVALSNLFWSQSRLHSSLQRPDLAAKYAQMAHATLATTEHTTFAARALLLQAQLANDRDRPQEAVDLLDEAEPILSAGGNRYDVGVVQLERARALARLGEPGQAVSTALGAVAYFEGCQPANAARGYSIGADILLDLGDDAKAAELFELAAELLPEKDRNRIDVYRKLSSIHERAGNSDEAMRYLKLAFDTQTAIRK